MKRTYQIEEQRARKRFEGEVSRQQPVIQLVLPMAELCQQMAPNVLQVMKQVGLQCLEKMMNWEAEQLVGPKGAKDKGRPEYRWSKEEGYYCVAGQKVGLSLPRVRDTRQREVALGSYVMIQQASAREEAVWRKMMHGLTTRRYRDVVREFEEAY